MLADLTWARLDRAAALMADREIGAMLLSVGADLPYLTGYEAMPLERVTMLVLTRDRATAGGSPAGGASSRTGRI